MNLVNVICQILVIDHFIGGRFLDYGLQIWRYNQHIDIGLDPMVEIFPKMTKCQFNRHGPGGDIIVRIIFFY